MVFKFSSDPRLRVVDYAVATAHYEIESMLVDVMEYPGKIFNAGTYVS